MANVWYRRAGCASRTLRRWSSGRPGAQGLFPDTTQQSYGMGWVISTTRAAPCSPTAGDGRAARPRPARPRKEARLAILSNLHQTPDERRPVFTLLESVLDLPRKRDWNAIHQAAVGRRRADAAEKLKRQLARRRHAHPVTRAGRLRRTYEHPALGTVRLRLLQGASSLSFGTMRRPWSISTTTPSPSPRAARRADVVFDLDRTGAVTRFAITGNFNVTFTRNKAHERATSPRAFALVATGSRTVIPHRAYAQHALNVPGPE